MSFSVSGKTAIVTGSANGIGLAIARHLADQGANVMCADADEKGLVAELGDAPEDGNIRIFAGDLRQRLTIANLVSATIDAFDQIDILVNASRQILPTDALDVEDDSVSTLIEQNMMTALRLSQFVSKRMIKHCRQSYPARIDGLWHCGLGGPADDPFDGGGAGGAPDQGECDLVRVGDEQLAAGHRCGKP
jgi:7-alpha-hydroxysteroid dehydrogenase